jgi:hypothetical protein
MNAILNIGLHSQSLNNPNGSIAGSEITTAGLQAAFLKHPEINSVYRFAPDNYNDLLQGNLNLVIIEGWHPSVPSFIEKIRKANPLTVVLFWNLSFYGFNEVVNLNVDGFLSNSKKNMALLYKIKPSEYVMLAADSELFCPQNSIEKYKHDVTFLGMNHPNKSNEVINLILQNSTKFDLAIYGSGWETNVDFKPYWKGKLPVNDIPLLYSSSKVVLGITEDRQRKAEMINNRVFEALSCGTCFVSDYSPEMERVFGDTIFFSKEAGDTQKHIDKIINNYDDYTEHKKKAREIIIREHTYFHRVNQIMQFYKSF